jgi:hypothetical protein
VIFEFFQLKEEHQFRYVCRVAAVPKKLSASLIALTCGIEFGFQNRGIDNAHLMGLLAACNSLKSTKSKFSLMHNAQCTILPGVIDILEVGSSSVFHVSDPARLA